MSSAADERLPGRGVDGRAAPVLRPLDQVEPVQMSAVLGHERACWARIHWDYAPTSRLIQRAVGTRGVSGFALVGPTGDAIAYAYYLASRDRSVIGSVHALPEGEAYAGAATLLDRCLAHLVRDVEARRIESQFLHFGTEDLAPIYRSWGARPYEREFLCAPLTALRGAVRPVARVRAFRTSDIAAAADVIYRSFIGSVDAEMSQCYATRAGCAAFVEGVVLRDGCGLFDRDASVVCEGAGGLTGVLLASRVGTGVGHVVQVSVAPDAQGHGVGQSLLMATAERLRATGQHTLTLSVSVDNARARSWYHRVGFHRAKSFHAWVRTENLWVRTENL